jgi:Bacterial alpha-L-rhamnosidase 6 hairpin glycosidase domain
MKIKTSFILLFLFLLSCSTPETRSGNSVYSNVIQLPALEGKPPYLSSPFVTAGDRVYLVGYQDGSFPDLGWHIAGEMGGIWDHPIKLMDGFTARIETISGESFCLNQAEQFVNYPVANRHYFIWKQENLAIDRTQFVPDGIEGVVIEFRIVNQGSERKELTFSFTGQTDLRPTWLGERTGMIDGEDEIAFDKKLSAAIAKDKKNLWYAMFGSLNEAIFSVDENTCQPNVRNGSGKNATLSYSITLEPNGEMIIPIFIAGSYQSEDAVRITYGKLKEASSDLLTQKIARYKTIEQKSHLTIPEKNIGQMYKWLKYNTDWLKRNVPEQGIGLSAGLPDYPWWFGADATYALQGVLATGDHELAKNTILLLHKISQQTNNNGRVIHEVSTNGAVYNPGNVNETAQFITLVNTYFNWTGDKELVAQLFPDLKKGIKWLLEERDPDGNGYPNGSGMMEIPGLESDLEMIDVAVYTQQALTSAAGLATAVGENTTAVEYQTLADELATRINLEWWQPSANSFGDFRGTVAEAAPVLEAAMIRADTLEKSWSVVELKNSRTQMKKYPTGKTLPHVIYHNWVVNTPMETGVADLEKGKAALQTARAYENPFGVFVTGIDRTQEADSVVLKSRKKTFSYTGAVMTLPTGVQAVAAARYGEPEESLGYIKKLQQSFSYALPGSMYEVSPDFGMITQAWNIYGVAVPIIHYFFGIQPKAYEKSIYLSPRLPAEWKEASIENVQVGENSFSLMITQNEGHQQYSVRQTKEDWTILLNAKNAKKIEVNGLAVELKTLTGGRLKLTGKESVVKIF